jgi:2-oxoglutarate ferredoxin oxidoreductase subunit delta
MPTVKFEEARCKGCGLCVHFCPQKILRISSHLNPKGFFPAELFDETRCTGCMTCARMCPDIVIEVYREEKGESHG